MDGKNWEFWLNMTNFALGAITFLAVLVVFGAIGWELIGRRVRRAHENKNMDAELKTILGAGSDSRFVPGLGLTMADGGEKVGPSEPCGANKKPRQE